MEEYIEYLRYGLAILLFAVGGVMLAAGLGLLYLVGQEILLFINTPESAGLLQMLLEKVKDGGVDIVGNFGEANINIELSGEIKLFFFALLNVWLFAVLISIAKSLIEGGVSILKSILTNVFITDKIITNENDVG